MWAQYARPEKLSYSISKAATSAVARSLAVDLGPLGIQVNAISPGPIDSPMTRKNLSREQVERITSEAPLKRFVSLDEVVRIASKFAMGDMSGITGQDILVDAGWSVSKLV
jgi:NAD(P)-dependent dehydrogenase (short-subunit alcohol dehydrogenase family)